jgi:hypothetical protein
MRDLSLLRRHLRAALLAAPLFVGCGGGGSSTSPKEPGIVGNSSDGGMTAPPEEVALPTGSGGCGEGGQWCGPSSQAAKQQSRASNSARLDCPESFEANGLYFNLNDQETEAKRATGDGTTCCYYYHDGCVEGRPLLDHGQLILAEPRPGTGWAAAPASAARHDALAALWLRDALVEHASIASFARAAQELLAAGAPASLVAACHRAALDEIRHAELSFALAARYAGRAFAPGPLPALPARAGGLARIVADTFIEGCVAETAAVVRAERALAGCRDPEVARALRVIARDERRHAALAWRTVAWAVTAGGGAARDALAAAAAALPVPTPAETRDPTLLAHGRLDDAAAAEAEVDARAQIVRPLAALILEAHSRRGTLHA